jgi:uncharacterized protein YndB with AHSA1/START domain
MTASNAKNKLIVTTPSDLEIILTREFDAPRRLVFEALSKAEHVMRWWGPRNTTLLSCEIDFRPGGTWHKVLRGPDGREVQFKGTYHEIVPPERIVATECFDEPSVGRPEWLATVTLEERGGKTLLTSRVLHKTKENRDGHLGSGMEKGAGETFDRLEELVNGWKNGKD